MKLSNANIFAYVNPYKHRGVRKPTYKLLVII